MTPTRKILGAAAFSIALAGGGVAGAMLGTPSLSNAQDSTQASDNAATDDHGGPLKHRREGLAAAAKALGMTEADLRTELEGGKSIAQVAEDKGIDLQTVIDALVADAMAHLKEIEAALPDRITELVHRTGWGQHGPGGGHHRPRFKGLEVAATVIGITPDELRTALDGGSSIAEVAAAHNVDVDKVIQALVDKASAKIDEAVANGRITASRAETMKAALTDRITAHVNGDDPGPGPDDGGDLGPVD